MPTRKTCIAIVLFWLGAVSWMFKRDVLPRLWPSPAPKFLISLTDEVGGRYVRWNAYYNNKFIGRGRSYVKLAKDRSFELGSELLFRELELVRGVTIYEMSNNYNVTKNGDLLRFESVVKGSLIGAGNTLELKVLGIVENGKLKLETLINNEKHAFLPARTVDISQHGRFLNSMHLVSKLGGLKVGNQWPVPMLDIASGMVPGQNTSLEHLDASVVADSMFWEKEKHACFKIEYRKTGKEPLARTWVRKSDGLVLKQEATLGNRQLVLLRTRFVSRHIPLHLPAEKEEQPQ